MTFLMLPFLGQDRTPQVQRIHQTAYQLVSMHVKTR